MATQIRIAQDEAADAVLSSDPFALLVGMLLDQQYPMEHAFRGPSKILERFGTLSPQAIAEAEPEAFADLCSTPPAIHRYGRSMAGRVQQLAVVVRDEYGGRAETIWQDAEDARDLLARLRALPGFGDQKARIFAALVGKQLDVRPAGWQEAVGPYAEDGSYRSVADVVDAESLAKVREFKQAAKAELKAKAAAAKAKA
ncbi:HhH-GPD-type base excision DNA repair protein [Pedococcus ginsenosidimutans]|uniref:HhH-GPD-type base excision DNA repair protein n=1 Tax=Pedococcus ginsenosidimutans TaxID=490570 RepID=A0ABP8Y3W0_9MICO